jgi:hypothetical protein
VSARTSPRTTLLTRVRAQSRRWWLHLSTIARPDSKNTAHSPFRPRYTCAHLPLGFGSLLGEARSDASSGTNRLPMRPPSACDPASQATNPEKTNGDSTPPASVTTRSASARGVVKTRPASFASFATLFNELPPSPCGGAWGESQVRTGLSAGGSRIRTLSPTRGRGSLCSERDGHNSSSRTI